MFDYRWVFVVSYKDQQKKFKTRNKALEYLDECMTGQHDLPIVVTVVQVDKHEYYNL